MKTRLISALIMALTLAVVLAIVPAMTYFNEVSFNGQGFAASSPGGSVLQTETCGVSDGAETNSPYLLWTLTAPGARNADISGPWGNAMMTRQGKGTFTYISEWYDSDDLSAHPVKAAFDGKPQKAWLVVSHGCGPD